MKSIFNISIGRSVNVCYNDPLCFGSTNSYPMYFDVTIAEIVSADVVVEFDRI